MPDIKKLAKKVARTGLVYLLPVVALFAAGLYLLYGQGSLDWLARHRWWWLPLVGGAVVLSLLPAFKGWRPGTLIRESLGFDQHRAKRPNSRRLVRRFVCSWKGAAGIFLLLIFTVLALFPSWFVPAEPVTYPWMEFRDMDRGPSATHPLGLTSEGEDVWTIVVLGARPVLLFAFQATVIAITVGGVIGALSGYLGGLADRLLTMLSETFLAFPSVFIIITVLSVTNNSEHRLWLVAIYGAAATAKVVRGEALKLRQQEYVEASQATGCSDLQTVFGHVLPNAVPLLLVQATLFSGQAVLLDAYVNFLGVTGAAGWAGALAESMGTFRSLALYREPWLVASTGMCLLLVIGAFNMLGDALRDALKLRM